MFEHVQERGRGPLHIVEREDQRPAPGEGLDTEADRPRGLLLGRGPRHESKGPRNAFGGETPLGTTRQEETDLVHGLGGVGVGGEARGLSDDVDERLERAALAVGRAPAPKHRVGLRVDPEELRHEPGLAQARASDQGHGPASSGRHMALEGFMQQPELRRPIDERRLRTGQDLSRIDHGQEPVRGHRSLETAEIVQVDRLGRDRVADDPFRGAVEEDLARPGVLLEPGREVHRRPHHERLARAPIARDHGPCRDARADREPHVPSLAEVGVRGVDHASHVPRRADGAQGVVLVRSGEAEDGHDRVADELLDVAAVTTHGGPCRPVVVAHHAMERFGVDPMRQVRGAGEIDEQDRHQTTGFGWLRDVHRPPARQAESSVLGVVRGARGT